MKRNHHRSALWGSRDPWLKVCSNWMTTVSSGGTRGAEEICYRGEKGLGLDSLFYFSLQHTWSHMMHNLIYLHFKTGLWVWIWMLGALFFSVMCIKSLTLKLIPQRRAYISRIGWGGKYKYEKDPMRWGRREKQRWEAVTHLTQNGQGRNFNFIPPCSSVQNYISVLVSTICERGN